MTSAPTTLGAWRDRTNLYLSYRQSYAHHPTTKKHHAFDVESERAGLMSNLDANGDTVIEMDLLPPRWLDIQDEITTYLSTIASQMKRLDSLHSTHVLPGFDDEAVKAKEEREISHLTSEVTKGFAASQRAIKRIDGILHSQPASQAEEKMARNLQISLASRVGDASTLFRKKQSAYLKKLRSLGGMSSPNPAYTDRAGTPAQNPYTDPALAEHESDLNSAQSTLQQTQSQQLRRRTGVMDAAIDQREREIEKIAQGVIDLSHIFQELNSMVIDQGSLLDRIDYNVERTAEQTKEAEKELTTATKYQRRGTRRLVILLLILLVVGMFILVLIKPRRSGGGGSKDPPGSPATPQNPGNGLPPVPRIASVDGKVSLEERSWAEWKKRRRRWGADGAGGFSFMPT